MSLTHALKWSFLSELVAKLIQPVVFVVLARLLTPEDFGVVAAAIMVISFSQVFWDAGMGKALIQRQTDVQEAANAAFWINVSLGVVIALILYLIASPVAHTVFDDERVAAVLQIMSLQVCLGAVSSVHVALLQKEMGFKKLFWVRFATVSLPGLVSIPLALNGMGYWAVVAGTLVGQAMQVVMLWHMSHWRPRWSFNVRVAKEMGQFGAWVGASGLLAWFYVWADSLVVGIYLGSHELGLYRTGNQFALMIFAMIFGPITPVLYSYLSRMNQDKERMRIAAGKIIRVLTSLAIPTALIVFSLSGSISTAVFGIKWQGLGFVIGVMALTHGFSWVVGMNGEFYRAMGKPNYEAIVTATTLVIYLAAYITSISYGFETFVWTRLFLALGALSFHLLVIRQLLALRLWPVTKHALLITSICTALVFSVQYLLDISIYNIWWKLTLGVVLSVTAVGMAVFLLERDGMLREISTMIRSRAA